MSLEVGRLSGFPKGDQGDLVLAARISDGDTEAFHQLMHRFNRTLYRVARSILKDAAQAEDAVQSAYLHAFCAMDEFRGQSKLSTWMIRIVTNEALSQLRKSRRRSEVIVHAEDWRREHAGAPRDDRTDAHPDGNMADVADASEWPDTTAFRGEVRRLIEAKIDQLPEAFRTVFVMRGIEEMTVEETAECLALPPATVRTRFFRARGLLRESLSHEIDLSMETVFGFGGDRCNRIAAHVLDRLNHERAAVRAELASKGGLHHEASV